MNDRALSCEPFSYVWSDFAKTFSLFFCIFASFDLLRAATFSCCFRTTAAFFSAAEDVPLAMIARATIFYERRRTERPGTKQARGCATG